MKTVNHECYVSLEVTKLLEKAGFDWKEYLKPLSVYDGYGSVWKIPLHIAQKWLRVVKGWECQVACETDENGNKSYVTELINPDVDLEDYMEYFPVYEEALEAGIKKCLELILEKGEQYDS